MGTFGYTSVGVGVGVNPADRVTITKETLASPQWITKLSVYLDGSGATGSQTLKGVIYADAAGVADALLATSIEVTVTSGQAAGWVDCVLAQPVSLAAADYWLGVHMGGTANNVVLYAGGSGSGRYNITDTYSDGAASPCPSGGSVRGSHYSMYATYGTLHSVAVVFALELAETFAATLVSGGPVITAPTAGESAEAGDVPGTATFTHPSGGSFRYEWEVDTDNPPSAGGNYQQVLTGYAVTSPRSVALAALTAGTWYLRARVDDAVGTSSWSTVLTIYVFETILLKAGSSVDLDTTAVSNKVFAKVEGTSTVASATNSDAAYPPTYADSPRERLILMKAGDATAAQAVADAGLVVWREKRYAISGLQVRLQDGLKIEVGDRVAVNHALSGVSAWLPVRQLVHDFAADTTTIDVGEVRRVPDDETLLLQVAAKLELLRKDSA